MIRTIALLLAVCVCITGCATSNGNGIAGAEAPPPEPSIEQAAADQAGGKKPPQPAQTVSDVKDANTPANFLTWKEFFDDDKQSQPSAKFKQFNGQNVVIDGYMGEILSMDKGWFLLIPRPGAECPFDNGDQSYWNSIMIVFVKDKEQLRHTNGALRVTGRLDVGVKQDESGYKTMFRLYDAEFEKK
ncbi:hypothetical protein [Paenibacillus xerothermodurans]|uniref:Lipoprotein n=1 Tax=Paenibacillus xerothermodurans TaxID=1977292 RepID=A0A2W1NB10_PAEXE|nr:hypothetical protein [Paenibacillus xerothermodurans]PZE20840.1 hypothetical protein CBW46_011860 [Paenibacillus xerothermodurans]